jgi:hypothetical protein
MASFNVDFSKITGKVKPLHGICMPPLLGVHNTSLFHYLKDAGIPMCRLHDVGGPFGGTHLVDVENIFESLANNDKINIMGFDLVEVASDRLGDITAVLAAKMIYDFLTLFA